MKYLKGEPRALRFYLLLNAEIFQIQESNSNFYIQSLLKYFNSLKNLKYLTKVVLLGCSNVKDEGVKDLARNLFFLEDIDIGGTNVTGESLRELVTMCLNLKKVNITGCKRLNASDD
jgi:hypothetical protein